MLKVDSLVFLQKLKNRIEILLLESIEFPVTTVQNAITLILREHQANCRNQKQHSAVVDHSAIGHSWGFTRAIVVQYCTTNYCYLCVTQVNVRLRKQCLSKIIQRFKATKVRFR